jgi:hypothetical protein
MEATDKQIHYIEKLLEQRQMDEQYRQDILKEIYNGISISRASEIIEHLKTHY